MPWLQLGSLSFLATVPMLVWEMKSLKGESGRLKLDVVIDHLQKLLLLCYFCACLMSSQFHKHYAYGTLMNQYCMRSRGLLFN